MRVSRFVLASKKKKTPRHCLSHYLADHGRLGAWNHTYMVGGIGNFGGGRKKTLKF
jgi:hypothetical protein